MKKTMQKIGKQFQKGMDFMGRHPGAILAVGSVVGVAALAISAHYGLSKAITNEKESTSHSFSISKNIAKEIVDMNEHFGYIAFGNGESAIFMYDRTEK